MNNELKEVYGQVYEFLSLVEEKYLEKIPSGVIEFFKNQKDENYVKKINPNVSIREQNLKEETIAIIAMLNLNYWCEDEIEKRRLKEIYAKNEINYQRRLCQEEIARREKERRREEEIAKAKSIIERSIVVYKNPPLYKRILLKIKILLNTSIKEKKIA